MDVWEVPQSSCSGLDKGFLMDVGPMGPPAINEQCHLLVFRVSRASALPPAGSRAAVVSDERRLEAADKWIHRDARFGDLGIGQSQTNDSGPPLPLARVLPSGEKAKDSSRFLGPVSVCRSAPVRGSQSLIVRSLHP